MNTLFENILQSSFQGSIVILAVLALRFLLRKAPKKFTCMLWLLAGIRLLMPFEIQSSMSLQPPLEPVAEIRQEVAVPVAPEFEMVGEPVAESIPAVAPSAPAQTVQPQQTQQAQPVPQVPAEPVEETKPFDWMGLIPWVWLSVAGCFGVYTLVSYLRMKRKVRFSVKIPGGWECDQIETAFILGFIRPNIYIPMGMTQWERQYILAHERTHLEKGDHWIKMVGFLALALHWFNPLVWVAYILLCKDIELACDERVVQFMELKERKAYSAALLNCSTNRAHFAACPVAFGEVSVKERIKTVLNYKRPSFWISLIGVIAICFVAVCLVTSPVEEKESGPQVPVETEAASEAEEASVADRVEKAWEEILSGDKYHLFFSNESYSGGVGWQVNMYKDVTNTLWRSSDHINEEGRMVLDGVPYKLIQGNDGGWVPCEEADTLLEEMLAEFSLEGKEITDIASEVKTNELGSYEKLTFTLRSEGANGQELVQPVTVFFDLDGKMTGMRIENTTRKGADIFSFADWTEEMSDVNNMEQAFRNAGERLLDPADVDPDKLRPPTEDEQSMKDWGIQYRVDDDLLTRYGGEVWFCQADGYDMAIRTDNEYWLEKKTDTGWEKLELLAEPNWAEANYTLGHGMYTMVKVDWTSLYGPLSSGTYRMGKTFEKMENGSRSCTGYAEFTIYYNEANSEQQKAAVERCYAGLEALKQRDHIHYLSTSQGYSTEEVWWNNGDYLYEGKHFWEGATGVTQNADGEIEPRVDIMVRKDGVGYSEARERQDDLGSKVIGMRMATLSPNRAGWLLADFEECLNILFFERDNKAITFPDGVGIVSDNVVRFQKTWPVQGMDVSEVGAVMTYKFDDNGDLCYMEYKTDDMTGVISIEIFDTTAEEIDAKIKPYTEDLVVDSFSWEEAKAKYTDAEFNIRENSFVNNGGSNIAGPVDAAKLALKEYPNLGEYLSVDVFRDEGAGMWKVTVESYVDYQSTYAYRDIYITDDGATQLLVYEGPIGWNETRK